MEWLTDSIAFWLRIKTPTMGKLGKRKSNKDKKPKNDDLFELNTNLNIRDSHSMLINANSKQTI